MGLLRKATAVFDSLMGFFVLLAIGLLVFMVLSVTYEIVMRYFLGKPTVWVVELTEHSMVYFTFLVAPWLLRQEGHVRMDMVLSRLRPGAQVVLNTITSSLGALVFLVVAWYGAKSTWDLWQTGFYIDTMLDIPVAYLVVVIPVCSFMLFIQFIRRTGGFLMNWRVSQDRERELVTST